MAGTYTAPEWLSAEARDLLARMLTVDPAQRITLEGVLQHPWVRSTLRWEPPNNYFAVQGDASGE
jgi:serine/threonine protein kinase